jgi:nucleoid-associated protein YgaU
VAKGKSVETPLLPVRFQIKQLEETSSRPWEPARIEAGIPPRAREYRIHKLDTLEDLAERFFGSRERAQEIFEANRDVLKSPQVLPLGAVIRIPGANFATGADGDLRPIRNE